MIEQVQTKNKFAFARLENIMKNYGYIPRRYLCHYEDDTIELTNGLGHALFNLTDDLLKGFTKDDRRIFCLGLNFGEFTFENVEYQFIDTANMYGLDVKECRKNDLADKRSWKVALYVDEYGNDCHFLKEERNEIWTGKLGFYQDITLYPSLPKHVVSNTHEYTLGKTFMITNFNGKDEIDQAFKKNVTIEI